VNPESESLTALLCASMVHVPDLAEAGLVHSAAADLIDRISYRHRVHEFYPVLAATVAAGRVPAAAVDAAGGHDEAGILNFLTRLTAELDARRPWPDPALAQVSSNAWTSPGGGRPIAWLRMPKAALEAALHGEFESVADGELLLVRLRPGRLVAFLGERPRVRAIRRAAAR
jgi:hypothetical protein